MSTIQAIKNRINTAQNILHITEAMELVAGIQYRKLQKKMDHFNHYSKMLLGIVDHLKLVADQENPPLFKRGKSQNIMVMVMAGDKGLCGSYNTNVIFEAEELIKSFHTENIELILFGKKAVDYFKQKQWKIRKSDPSFVHAMSQDAINALSEECINLFLNNEIGELWVAYTHFKGILKIEAMEYNILPFANPASQKPQASVNFIFDPDPQDIYIKIMSQFFRIKLESLFLESYASELTSRIVAMKSSTKNAEDMIEDLTLIKNKLRQLNITKEIQEISIGAESLK